MSNSKPYCFICGTPRTGGDEVILVSGDPGERFVEVFDTIKNPDDYKDLHIVHGTRHKSGMPEAELFRWKNFRDSMSNILKVNATTSNKSGGLL